MQPSAAAVAILERPATQGPDIEQVILDYGKAHDYPPLVVGDVQVAAGSQAWYRFVWTPGPSREDRRVVYDALAIGVMSLVEDRLEADTSR